MLVRVQRSLRRANAVAAIGISAVTIDGSGIRRVATRLPVNVNVVSPGLIASFAGVGDADKHFADFPAARPRHATSS